VPVGGMEEFHSSSFFLSDKVIKFRAEVGSITGNPDRLLKTYRDYQLKIYA